MKGKQALANHNFKGSHGGASANAKNALEGKKIFQLKKRGDSKKES